jgi:hypothetical protein
MRPALSIALALCLAAGAASAAETPPKAIWDSTARILNDAADSDLREPENAGPDQWGRPTAAMFSRTLDINGDGVRDWKVDYGAAPNGSLFCGTGGCTVELWVSQPGGGFSRVFNTLVREVKLSRRAGVTRLDRDFHGSACGGAGVQACDRGYLWDEEVGWVPTANARGKTWLYGGPFALNDDAARDYPADVGAALERIQAACPPGGGEAERQTWSVTAIPDINGDGAGDWVVGGPYDACAVAQEGAAAATDLPVMVLASNGEGHFREAYSDIAMGFGVDIGTTPASFYAIAREAECGIEDADLERPCGTRLRWDAAHGKLVR